MADLQAAAVDAANQAGVDPDFFTSLIGNGEKGFDNPGAVSPAGARGPAQLMPGTAADMGVQNIDDPVQNLQGGARYAAKMLDRYNGDQSLAAAAYNAGPGAVDRHGGVPPYPETQAYVSRVMGGMQPSQADLQAAFDASQNGGQAAPSPHANGVTVESARRLSPAELAQLEAEGTSEPPSQDELQQAFDKQHPDPVQTPASPPQIKLGAMPWDNIQQQDQANLAESARLRAAPLPSVGGEIGSAFNTAMGNLKTDTGNWFQNRPPIDGGGNAIGDGLAALTSPISGAYSALVAHPLSKATGFPIADINRDMMGLAPEMPGAVPSLIGKVASGAISAPAKMLAPFAARFSQSAAETQAGRYLAGQATDLPAVRASLSGGPDVTVPGSVPTTFQQTGDMGLGALERGVAAKNPAPFQQRAADQNVARVSALGDLQTGGNPQAVTAHLKDTFDALDARTQAHVDQLTQAAQGKAQAIGGNVTPEDSGETIRGIVNTAEQGARARESGLWNAVDPNGDLTGNTTATSQAAKDIAGSIPTTAKPMQGEEAGIFDAAQSMPHLSPVSDLIALRSRLSTEMRSELIGNGRSPAYARMAQLRGAIQDNLANSVSDAVQARPEVASRLDAWDNAEQQFHALTSSGVGGGGYQPSSGSGSPPVRGALGATSAPGGRFGDAAGAPGLPGSPSFSPPRLGESGTPPGSASTPPQLAPTFDTAAAGRLTEATAATRLRAATFGQQPISSVTAKAGDATQFRLSDGRVPGRFFHPGPSGYTDMQSLLSATPQAAPAIQDYAASTLRRAAMNEDGTLDPAKFSRWQAQHADAIRALPPQAQARFADAASATQAVGDAAVNRATQLKAAQAGAIGKMISAQSPEEVTSRIGNVLNGPTRVSDMQTLANATAGNTDARAGLRQAVADHIASKYVGNTEAGTSGVGTMKADPFQNFMRQSKPALAKVFSQPEIDGMQAIADDIARSKRSQTALKIPGGSNSVQDAHASGLATGGMAHGVGRVVMDMISAGIGEHLIPSFGSEIGLASGEMINALRSQGIARVNDLVSRAMLEPSVARALLQRVPSGAKLTPASMQGRTLVRALAGPGLSIGPPKKAGAPAVQDLSPSAPRLRPPT